jgi:hypothetical protein
MAGSGAAANAGRGLTLSTAMVQDDLRRLLMAQQAAQGTNDNWHAAVAAATNANTWYPGIGAPTPGTTWPSPGTTIPYPITPSTVFYPPTVIQPPPIVMSPDEMKEIAKESFDMIVATAHDPRQATAHCQVCSAIIIWADGGWRKHRANCQPPLPRLDIEDTER